MVGGDISKLKVQNAKFKIDRRLQIGVFDSGIGGRLVAERISRKISEAEIILKSDPEYFPYGNKPPDVILKRLVYFIKELAELKCETIVVACNTATTNTIGKLRKMFPEQIFVGMEPPIKPIIELTKTGKAAVMATEATIASRRFEELKGKFSNGKKVIGIACPGLAEEIEKLWRHRYLSPPLENSVLINLVKIFLDKPVAEGVDAVGLGCTHYPYILPILKKLYPGVIFYDPAEAVAVRVAELVKK